jgi:hypothetical protein
MGPERWKSRTPAPRRLCPENFFDPLVGITFENSSEDYDIILDTDDTHGVSAIHFRTNCI